MGDYLGRFIDEDRAEQEQLLALLAALDDIEGRKLNRFGAFAATALADPAIASNAFLKITRPDKQIETIVGELHHVLTHATQDPSLEIVLAQMEGDLPVRWRCQMPNDILLPDSLLGQAGGATLFSFASKTRRTQVIEDIEVHLSKKKTDTRFVPRQDPDEDKGSILCKPLYSPHLKGVPYVLSIKSRIHKIVSKAFEKRFRLILDSFCTRLLLEAHLEVIRKLAGGNNDEG